MVPYILVCGRRLPVLMPSPCCQVSFTDDGLEAIVFTAEGDMRQALNNLQSTFRGFRHVNSENVFKVGPRGPLWCRGAEGSLFSDVAGALKMVGREVAIFCRSGLWGVIICAGARIHKATLRSRATVPFFPCSLYSCDSYQRQKNYVIKCLMKLFRAFC